MDRRSFATAVALGGAAAVLGARPAHAAPPPEPMPRARNVVLVHGAYADGSCWSDVIPHLQARGLNVASVQNPLRTLEEDCDFARRTLALMDGPTVLVAHSYSGMIVTEVGVDPKVTALVYIAARAPDAGEDYTALAAQYPTPPASAGVVKAPDGYAQLSEEAFLSDFAQDVDPFRARMLYAVQGRISSELFTGRTTQAAWRDKPTFYAVSKNDRTINPDLERFMAHRMNASTIELDASHLSMVSKAKEVSDLIIRAAGA
ncbi:alpha/beta fold hydrolase [Mycobacterium sp.]|uniref:alpha/beta fold hydrolase n=1 Tax=Mycobacterium sp. TaxID=1785 RepID=UPI002D96B447|nr:alpha/beta hydrolase [Mycobacterium sp.]